ERAAVLLGRARRAAARHRGAAADAGPARPGQDERPPGRHDDPEPEEREQLLQPAHLLPGDAELPARVRPGRAALCDGQRPARRPGRHRVGGGNSAAAVHQRQRGPARNGRLRLPRLDRDGPQPGGGRPYRRERHHRLRRHLPPARPVEHHRYADLAGLLGRWRPGRAAAGRVQPGPRRHPRRGQLGPQRQYPRDPGRQRRRLTLPATPPHRPGTATRPPPATARSIMPEIPASHRDLLDGGFATLATIGPDGRPQLSEVWFLADGDTVALSLNTTRQKVKNLRANPAANVFLLDLAVPYRYLELRGDAEITPDDDYSFADQLGAKYQADLRSRDHPGESRVKVTIHPTRINAADMRLTPDRIPERRRRCHGRCATTAM